MSDEYSPVINVSNERYWNGLEKQELRIQFCPVCDEHVFPPRIACPHCFDDLEWVKATGDGVVYSYGVAHRVYPSGSVPEGVLPVTGAIIELAEGPLLVSNIIELEGREVQIGDAVEVKFEEHSSGINLPYFTLK